MKIRILFCCLGKAAQRRRQRRDTFTAADLLVYPTPQPAAPTNKGSTSSSPIPITHSFSQSYQHSNSQPVATGYRRIYSPLTIDTSTLSLVESSPRRYSASAAVSPPNHQHSLNVPPIFNLIPPSPQQMITVETLKHLTNHQWHIPIILYGCNKIRLASTLLLSDEELLRIMSLDGYIDCTKDDNDSTNGTAKTSAPTVIQNLKPRKRGIVNSYELNDHIFFLLLDNSRRHDEDTHLPHEKQIDDMRESLDYAFATGTKVIYYH